ncbi:MAG: 50S ribosome-binding GTPase, partial [Actinomycetota bacterium]|nr:50S ribosome-binding GTPase [Actinomycetota bacterium]
MPHRTQMQVIKRRLVGKEGAERIRELRAILAELPNYRSGPYADIRKWVNAQLAETRARSRVVHRDSIAVRREGAAQVALVGPPNAGKSSLLQALSNVQIKTGDYAFTTTRPVPALTRIGGVLVQLVEIPGLIGGASEGRGGGRALLGVLREDGRQEYAPQPDVAAIKALVEDVRASGLDVDLIEEGLPQPLPAGPQLAAYRIVQE